MGQAKRAQFVSAHVLLFAIAIQGITPDSQDLASLNILRMLCPQLCAPQSPTDDDESTDDVCGSVQIQVHEAVRKRLESQAVSTLGFVWTGHYLCLISAETFRLPCPPTWNQSTGDLIYSLCRLTC
jgi:hypothetical protein